MHPSTGFGLRPRSIGELLDLTFRVFRARFGMFAVLGIAITVLNAVISLLVNALTWNTISFNPLEPTADPGGLLLIYVFAALAGLISIVVHSVGAMAITAGAQAVLLGHPITTSGAFLGSVGRAPVAAITGAVVGLAVGLGLVLCCLPAIPVGIMLALAVPLVYLERRGPIEAVIRSYELVFKRGPVDFSTESSWLRVFVVGIVTVIVIYVIAVAATLPLLVVTGAATAKGQEPVMTPLGPQFVGLHIMLPLQLLGAVLQGIFMGVTVIPWTVLYYDIKARREGLDLERQLERLEQDEPAGGATP